MLALATRLGRQIINTTGRGEPTREDHNLSAKLRRKYPDAGHRPTGPSRVYNCHGLTFACRRTWLGDIAEVAKILDDDGYRTMEPGDVLVGDVALYYADNELEHSGLVVGEEPAVIILSKWGKTHEVVHRVEYCPYWAGDVRYCRVIG